MPFGSHIRPGRELDLDSRRAVHGYIQRNPGAHYSRMLRELGLPNGVLQHNLRVLEEHGLVYSRAASTGWRMRHYFPMDFSATEAGSMCGREPTGREHRALLAAAFQPGISQRGIIERTELPRSTVSYALRMLASGGFVRLEHEGRSTRVYPVYPDETGLFESGLVGQAVEEPATREPAPALV